MDVAAILLSFPHPKQSPYKIRVKLVSEKMFENVDGQTTESLVYN